MLKVLNLETWGFEHAIRGMRNPMNSWDYSDSEYINGKYMVGEEDLKLMHKLYIAGTSHRKFLRQIFISMDIIAPLYWWKEFDTYKVGTVSNSTSTMHTLHKRELTKGDFSIEHLKTLDDKLTFYEVIGLINSNIKKYKDTQDKEYWYSAIQMLPSSFDQLRTITMSYENVVSIIEQRSDHKLDEWHQLIDYFVARLPWLKEIIFG